MRSTNFAIVTASDMSADITSAAFNIQQVYGWAAQFIYTGTPAGTLKIQVSCDNNPGESAQATPTNWTDYTGSSVVIAAAGNTIYNVDLSFYNWVRFVFTASGGSAGALTGRMNIKGV